MRARAAVLLAFALTGLGAPPARAEGAVHVAVTTLTQFPLPEIRVLEGDRLFLVNANIPWEQDTHDLTDAAFLSGEPVRFGSRQVRAGEVAEVEGVSSLAPGRYPFACSVPTHWTTMYGTLVVERPPA